MQFFEVPEVKLWHLKIMVQIRSADECVCETMHILQSTFHVCKNWNVPKGVLSKRPLWGRKSASYETQNFVYEWVNVSKFSRAKIGSNLRKFLKNQVILLKIWQKIGPIGIRMGHFFLKNCDLYGSIFKFRSGTSLPNPNLSTPTFKFFA